MKYNVSLQTIAWLNGRKTDETLVISPKFQRRAVWLEKERSELIETIVSALPFPEIYIHHQTDPQSGREQHTVVDGQQRVTSILMFIDNQIPLPENDDWQGQYFRDLTEAQREEFWDYKIVVRGLSQTNDAEIRNLFARLNTNSITLNDQELRNARFRGPFKALAERMADNPAFLSIGLYTARDIRRMVDVEFASELLLLNVEGITNKKDMLDDAYERFEEEFPEEARFESEFNFTLSLIMSLIDDTNVTAIKTKSNFYSLYGACLRYFRQSGHKTFRRPLHLSVAIGRLLNAARTGEIEGKPPEYTAYFEAVSRAASDRGRRKTREGILFDLILKLEQGDQTELPLQS